MARVVIFGTGRGAETAFRYLKRDSPHEICAFAIDAAYIKDPTFQGLPVVEYESVTSRFPPDAFHMFVPLGFQQMNRLRAQRYLDAKARGYRFISYVSSRLSTVEEPRIGENCLILDGQFINLDVSIGNNVTMWSGNHVGDRTVIGDHTWISSHVSIAGDVVVGDGCFLGVNSSVSNGVRLGDHTFVGAQTLIDKDTAADSVYIAPSAKQVPISSEKFLAMLRVT
jgi:sugar O-acyltransferase (sialic acid O-acetyltransferase NeuD family)